MVRVYIDEILLITKNYFNYHQNALEKLPQRLSEAGLNISTEKSLFGKNRK